MKKENSNKKEPVVQVTNHQPPVNNENVQSYYCDCTELDFYLRDRAKNEFRPKIIVLKDSHSGQIVQLTLKKQPPIRRDIKALIERTFARVDREQRHSRIIIPDDQPFKHSQGAQ